MNFVTFQTKGLMGEVGNFHVMWVFKQSISREIIHHLNFSESWLHHHHCWPPLFHTVYSSYSAPLWTTFTCHHLSARWSPPSPAALLHLLLLLLVCLQMFCVVMSLKLENFLIKEPHKFCYIPSFNLIATVHEQEGGTEMYDRDTTLESSSEGV